MKKIKRLLLITVLLASSLMFTGCDCDHEYGNWTTVKKATCTEDGEKERKCSECGYTETKEIKAPGHDYVDGVCTECSKPK